MSKVPSPRVTSPGKDSFTAVSSTVSSEPKKRAYGTKLMNSISATASATKEDSGIGSRTAWRSVADAKVVGLKNYGLAPSVYEKRQTLQSSLHSRKSVPSLNRPNGGTRFSVEEKEEEVRRKATTNPCKLLYLGNLAALKVMLYYMITLETIISCTFTVGLTLYWYFAYSEDSDWQGGGLDFVLLAFALTAPMSAALSIAFTRRERALITIADFRSWSYHLYLAHSLWDWSDSKGGREGADVDWLEHCDAVMAQLIGIGDELARFLSLPTTSRSRHRMTRAGRKEASRTIEVAYHLLESMATQRMTRLVLYSERLKKIGLPSGEVSRMRQFERFLSSLIEQLRMVKMYRTPQAFRSFARIFTLVLPPFYAPTYAQVGKEVNSLGVGIAFGIITSLGLTALFESLQILEDPFTAFLALDGIDVREEFEVLHYAQLTNTRRLVFPDAPPFPPGRRAALTSNSKPGKLHTVGLPPPQGHHYQPSGSKAGSVQGLDIAVSTDMLNAPELADDDLTMGGFDEEEAVELGTPMDEEEDMLRTTAFLDTDDLADGSPRPRLTTASSASTLRPRHVREWSRG